MCVCVCEASNNKAGVELTSHQALLGIIVVEGSHVFTVQSIREKRRRSAVTQSRPRGGGGGGGGG